MPDKYITQYTAKNGDVYYYKDKAANVQIEALETALGKKLDVVTSVGTPIESGLYVFCKSDGKIYMSDLVEGSDPPEYEWIEVNPNITVDNALSTTSNNPIANAPVATAVNNLTSLVGQKPTIVANFPAVDVGVVVLASDGLVYLWDDDESYYRVADYPSPDLTPYKKNLIAEKASDITAAQIAEYDTFDTSGEPGEGTMVFGEVAEGDHNPVDGDAVYKAMRLDKNGTLTFTTTSAVTSGTIRAYRRGNVVVVVLNGVYATYGATDTVIVTGLPPAIVYYYYPALSINSEDKRSLIISPEGTLAIGLGTVSNLWQTIMYLTDE